MRLIDADELKKCAIPCEIHNGALTDLCVPLYQIDNAPTVDGYTKRLQGEWKLDSVGVYCSECKKHHDYSSDFCPYCGADMKGGTE